MAYTPYYANGWQDGSSGGTPINAAALNNIENGLQNLIKTKTITATTSAYGYIGTGTVNLPNNTIIAAVPTAIGGVASGNYVALVFSGNGLMIYNRGTMAVAANLEVTVVITYI